MSLPTFWPVQVEYLVRRTVYVQAVSDAEARRLALDPENWADSEPPSPRMDTLRLAAVD